MQQWEYHAASLSAVAVSLTKNKGWRLKVINEQEQPNWKRTEIYASVIDFCNQMGQQGWELISVTHHEPSFTVLLYFKRPSIQRCQKLLEENDLNNQRRI